MEKNVWRRWRKALGKDVTQRKVAELFDPVLTPAAVSNWEHGIGAPKLELADQAARVYGKPLPEVLKTIHEFHRDRSPRTVAAK